MTIPKLTPYTGQVANPDGSQTQTEFTQNMFDQLSYEAQLATELDATVDGINQAVTDVENSANSASASATAAEAAASTAGYQGLWPDTGGSADKGDTWQTQVGGTPTGEYYTALQNTSVDPVGDDVNWKRNGDINRDNLSDYTDIVYKSSGGNSAVENMIAGVPVTVGIGETCQCENGTRFRRVSNSGGDISDFDLLSSIYVSDFGKDSPSAQLAIDTADYYRQQYTNSELNSRTFGTTTVKLLWSATTYILESPLNATHYADWESEGTTVLLGSAIGQPSGAHYIVDNRDVSDGGLGFGCYKARFKGFLVSRCRGFLAFDNDNLDQGNIKVEDLQLKGLPEALSINATSSKFEGENVQWDFCDKACNIVSCDKATFKGGWVKEGEVQSDGDGTFSVNGSLTLDDVLTVPTPQTKNDTALVAVNGGSCRITNCRLGGESGNRTIINNYGEGDTSNNLNSIILENSSVYSASNTTVRLYKLPNYIKIAGNNGFTNNHSALSFDESIVSLDSEIARIGINLSIVIDNKAGKGIQESFYQKIAPYSQSYDGNRWNGVALQTSASSPVDLKFFRNQNNVDSFVVRKNRAFKIKLQTVTSAGDTYSEYIVKSDFSGSSASIQPVVEGATTNAPRLVVNAGVVQVVANSAATIDVQYSCERVDSIFTN